VVVRVLAEMDFNPSLTLNVGLDRILVRRLPLTFVQSLVLLKYIDLLRLLDRLLGGHAARLNLVLWFDYHLAAHHALLD
jgi:hypothetical protein